MVASPQSPSPFHPAGSLWLRNDLPFLNIRVGPDSARTQTGPDLNRECNRLLSSLVLGTQGLSLGSRLFDVIDAYSKRTDTHPRFRATLRWVARLILASIAGSWLFLYLDSVYQRRRAEAFFADLRSLDFATAGFPEVRDIVIRNGGAAFREKPGTTCTPRDCTFRLVIMTRLPRIPLIDRKAELLYATLPYIGVRSWVVGALFEVRDGKLYMSSTGAWEYRMERVDYSVYRQLVPLVYGVETRRDAASFEGGPCSSQDYQVWVDHGVVKFPANRLATCVVQSASTSVKRAFDVHLSCLNNPFRNCRFDELAPSAWADYSAKDGTGTRDPHK